MLCAGGRYWWLWRVWRVRIEILLHPPLPIRHAAPRNNQQRSALACLCCSHAMQMQEGLSLMLEECALRHTSPPMGTSLSPAITGEP